MTTKYTWTGTVGRAFILAGILLNMAESSASTAQAEQSGQRNEAMQIYSSLQCSSRTKAAVTPITNQAQLDKLLVSLQAHRLMQDRTRLRIDFNAQQILLVHMGQRPTAGYSVSLDGHQVQLMNEELIIPVQWKSPAPGQMLAQIITAPCILIQIPALQYQSIRVQDQSGITQLTYKLKKPMR